MRYSLLMTTTAQIIAEQIGNKAFTMMGAHSLSSSGSALTFKVRGSKKADAVKVTYEAGTDLYTVEAFKLVRGKTWSIRKTSEGGVYVDSLHTVIEGLTGLYLGL
jgi:hypothetical protein